MWTKRRLHQTCPRMNSARYIPQRSRLLLVRGRHGQANGVRTLSWLTVRAAGRGQGTADAARARASCVPARSSRDGTLVPVVDSLGVSFQPPPMTQNSQSSLGSLRSGTAGPSFPDIDFGPGVVIPSTVEASSLHSDGVAPPGTRASSSPTSSPRKRVHSPGALPGAARSSKRARQRRSTPASQQTSPRSVATTRAAQVGPTVLPRRMAATERREVARVLQEHSSVLGSANDSYDPADTSAFESMRQEFQGRTSTSASNQASYTSTSRTTQPESVDSGAGSSGHHDAAPALAGPQASTTPNPVRKPPPRVRKRQGTARARRGRRRGSTT